MDSIRVQGGTPLQGKVKIQGSKNAALPILAACLLTNGQTYLENVPKISDIYGMIHMLEELGCTVRWEQGLLKVDPSKTRLATVSTEVAASMRSSIFLLGALLGRFGAATLDHPGGCVIGKRPIDLHLRALEKLGVRFCEEEGRLEALADELHAADIALEFPSVGATENIIMAAVVANGETVIRGAAKEPEVHALCDYLISCGAVIRGMGTDTIVIHGGRELSGSKFHIPADRIVAGTYLLTGFATGGSAFFEGAPIDHMKAVCLLARRMGARIAINREGMYVQYPERSREVPFLKTDAYPGFPTDLQSVVLAVRCTGRGTTLIRESIFENRFRIVQNLKDMGGDVRILDDRRALVKGVTELKGARVCAQELRGGAALLAAAAGANGETILTGKRFIDRGYENICRDLRKLGVRIVSE